MVAGSRREPAASHTSLLARGGPACGHPRPWSILDGSRGRPAAVEEITDLVGFDVTLADFVGVLHSIDTSAEHPAGEHCFFRGELLSTYDDETRTSISELAGEIEAAATAQWDEALATKWTAPRCGCSLTAVHRTCSSWTVDSPESSTSDAPPLVTRHVTRSSPGPSSSGQSRAAFKAHLPVDVGDLGEGTWLGAVECAGHAG